MNFDSFFLKSFRILLFPFALLYGLVVVIRNRLFDKGYLSSVSFNIPMICVGNISVGGTGKSPMVEYLVSLLHNRFKIATLSRGYKRKTEGYALANEYSTALEIGDEPMQFHLKFPDLPVAVGEERIEAIPQLLHDKPDTQAIILDDAFQHRTVKAGFNIVLTEYNNLFTRDFFLPMGDLRDQPASVNRAQIIVITKCPIDLSIEEKNHLIQEISPKPHQHVFFSAIAYDTPYHILDHTSWPITENDEVLLICGIANPVPLKKFLNEKVAAYYEQTFTDHHIFNIDDLYEILQKFRLLRNENKYILTTEKDAVRLMKFKDDMVHMPVYVLPIKPVFLFNEGGAFDNAVIDFIQNFTTTNVDEIL